MTEQGRRQDAVVVVGRRRIQLMQAKPLQAIGQAPDSPGMTTGSGDDDTIAPFGLGPVEGVLGPGDQGVRVIPP